MNVLMIGNDFHSIYYTRKELVKELVKKNKVFVAIPQNQKNKLIEEMGCTVIPLEMSRMGMNPFAELKVVKKIKDIIKDVNADIIYTFTIKPNVYTGLLQRKCDKKQIVTITGLGRLFQNNGIKKMLVVLLYRLAFRNSKKVFFENSENEKIFTNYNIASGKHVLVNGAGVNIDENSLEEYPELQDVLRLVFVGRIERDKGFRELVNAAQHYENKKNIEFIVLGTCEDSFRDEFEQMSIPSNIRLEGWQMDVHKYLKLSHAVILPSYHEGMANVLLEAAATGRPILASNIHGCMESFDEGISGYGFEKKNVEDMIRAIDCFYQLNNEQRREMGLCGRRKMEMEFDRKKVVMAFVEQLN